MTASTTAPRTPDRTPPTGTQHVLTRGDARAVITEVAASLREFTVGGVDITQPYDEFSTPPFGDGIVLMPWPNRVADGVWTYEGERMQLDLTEPGGATRSTDCCARRRTPSWTRPRRRSPSRRRSFPSTATRSTSPRPCATRSSRTAST